MRKKNLRMKGMAKRTFATVLSAATFLSMSGVTAFADDAQTDTQAADTVYVVMNIPYDEFYETELDNNDVAVDVVTSATSNKWKQMFNTTSYHAATETGGQILGITFPVETTTAELEAIGATEVEDSSTIYEAATYAYYTVESSDYYKTLTVDEDGSADFSAAVYGSEAVELTDASTTFATSTNYGDYQLNVSSETLSGEVYAVIVTAADEEGTETDYALRQLENIWRSGSQLSWSVGYDTTESHGNTLSYEHYASMIGKTVTGVTYYTSTGIYTVSNLAYSVLPKANDAQITATDAALGDTSVTIAITDLPEDFTPVFTIGGEEISYTVADDVYTLAYTANTIGSISVTISDANGGYCDLSTSFTVSTETVYAAFNDDNSAPALVAADGISDEDFASYISSISTVTVNGTSYSASGKRSTKIVGSDGALDMTVASNNNPIFTLGEEYTVVVSATGYPDVEFTFTYGELVLMNIPYAEFYEAELDNNEVEVDTVTSATSGKWQRQDNVYYEATDDGGVILGVTFPVYATEETLAAIGTEVVAETEDDTTDGTDAEVSTSAEDGSAEGDSSEGDSSEEGDSDTGFSGPSDLPSGSIGDIDDSSDTSLASEGDYAYTAVSADDYSYYKALTVETTGEGDEAVTTASFSAAVYESDAVELDSDDFAFATSSRYGDYEYDVQSSTLSGSVYAVIVTAVDEEGVEYDYGLRALENIWKSGSEISWSVGYSTTESHGNTLSYAHYASMIGKTISAVTYYTDAGIFVANTLSDKVYAKANDAVVTAADVIVGSESIAVTITDLPDDFTPVFTIDDAEVSYTVDGDVYTLAYTANTIGTVSIAISDASDTYCDLSASITVSTETVYAAFNDSYTAPALVAADGISDEDFAAYIAAISTVTVNDSSYSTSGRNSATIIAEDGTIDLTASVSSGMGPDAATSALFEVGSTYEITVSATGYQDLTFRFTYNNCGFTTYYKHEADSRFDTYFGTSAAVTENEDGTYSVQLVINATDSMLSDVAAIFDDSYNATSTTDDAGYITYVLTVSDITETIDFYFTYTIASYNMTHTYPFQIVLDGGTYTAHALTYVEAVDATETEDGNIAYYTCETCGTYYSDAEGTTALSAEDIVIAATGGEETTVSKEAGTYTVPVSLSDEVSAMNINFGDMLTDSSTIVVSEDGSATITLDFTTMTVMGSYVAWVGDFYGIVDADGNIISTDLDVTTTTITDENGAEQTAVASVTFTVSDLAGTYSVSYYLASNMMSYLRTATLTVDWANAAAADGESENGDGTNAETQAAADAVIALIEAIGTVTTDSDEAITAARTAYDALSDEAKALVTNLDTLIAAEAAYDALVSNASDDGSVDDGSGDDGSVDDNQGVSTAKKAQTIKVKNNKKTIKAKKLSKKKVTFKVKTTVNGNAKVTYKKLNKKSSKALKKGYKALKISKNGKVTVKKGTAKGTYKIKVKVTAKETSDYEEATKTITITVKVK